MGSISHQWLFNIPRGGHTHKNTHILILWTKGILRNQVCTSQRLVCTWFKNWLTILYTYLRMCRLHLQGRWAITPYGRDYKDNHIISNNKLLWAPLILGSFFWRDLAEGDPFGGIWTEGVDCGILHRSTSLQGLNQHWSGHTTGLIAYCYAGCCSD